MRFGLLSGGLGLVLRLGLGGFWDLLLLRLRLRHGYPVMSSAPLLKAHSYTPIVSNATMAEAMIGALLLIRYEIAPLTPNACPHVYPERRDTPCQGRRVAVICRLL